MLNALIVIMAIIMKKILLETFFVLKLIAKNQFAKNVEINYMKVIYKKRNYLLQKIFKKFIIFYNLEKNYNNIN